MSMDADFHQVIARVLAVDHLRLHAAAGAWDAVAGAGTAEHDRLAGAAADIGAERGEGLAELADRMRGHAGWAGDAGAMAARAARRLAAAAEAAARAIERTLALRVAYAEVAESGDEGVPSAGERTLRRGERAWLTAEAVTVVRTLDGDFGRVTGDTAPPAPERGRHRDVARPGEGDPVGAVPAPEGGVDVLAPERLSVLGPEAGDFEGWVRSPGTGHLVDPVTGREYDPGTSRWVDPITGAPFGEPTTSGQRFAGTGLGPGPPAAGVGLGRLGGLYGGVLPPSLIRPEGPTRIGLIRRADANLSRRATMARQLAMREAASRRLANESARAWRTTPGAAGARRGVLGA
ncbi:hypothetical protein [Streptomyces mayteni]